METETEAENETETDIDGVARRAKMKTCMRNKLMLGCLRRALMGRLSTSLSRVINHLITARERERVWCRVQAS